MSIQPRNIAAWVGVCLGLCTQAALAGPPGVPHYNRSASPPPQPYADRTKDQQQYVKKDASNMGLTPSATPQQLNGSAHPQPATRTGKPGTNHGNQYRQKADSLAQNLNVIYDSPTYDLYATKKKK